MTEEEFEETLRDAIGGDRFALNELSVEDNFDRYLTANRGLIVRAYDGTLFDLTIKERT